MRRFNHIADTLKALAFLGERFAVGGCVRDTLLGLEPHDVDITTPLHPEEVMRRAAEQGIRVIPTGIAHGTVTLLLGGEAVEVATYRRDVLTDGRHATVRFSETLLTDLARRGFTINTVAVNPTGKLIEPFGGQVDLAAAHLRAVGNPSERFTEDYLRVVLALRFSARFGLTIEPATAAALYAAASGVVQHVSAERVVDEFNKAFAHDGAGQFIRELYRDGVLQAFIGEFTDMDALTQSPLYHQKGDVLEHTCLVVDRTPTRYRWHTLLHDVGKGACAERVEGTDWFSFKGHEPSRRAARRLQSAAGVHLEALSAVCKADRMGRAGPTDSFLDALFTPIAASETTPALMGQHLIGAGWTRGCTLGLYWRELSSTSSRPAAPIFLCCGSWRVKERV